MARAAREALGISDYIEARLDFLRPEAVPDALESLGGMLARTVCTLRPRSEGGRFPGTEPERRSILGLVAGYSPFLIDVELSALGSDAALARRLRSSGTGILVSWHDFGGTPDTPELERVLARMSALSGRVKMVCTAHTAEDAARMLGLYAVPGPRSLISFAMGEHGRFSRVLCLHLGSPYTYVAAGRAVAPGQFGAGEMREIIGRGGRS